MRLEPTCAIIFLPRKTCGSRQDRERKRRRIINAINQTDDEEKDHDAINMCKDIKCAVAITGAIASERAECLSNKPGSAPAKNRSRDETEFSSLGQVSAFT